jgi:predicted RNase H-like HicB family nuclease
MPRLRKLSAVSFQQSAGNRHEGVLTATGRPFRFAAMNIKVVVERGEDGYYVAHCPALKSCWTQGKTKEEAVRNVREAIALYLEPSLKDLTGKGREIVEVS